MGDKAGGQESALRRLPWAAPFILLALFVAFDHLSSEQAWPVAALVLIGVVILIVPTDIWRKLVDRVEKAQFGPISLGLRRDVEDAAEFVPLSDQGEGTREPTGAAQSIFELRMRLEWKLVYIAKHLLATDEATFVTIGSLEFDGYLTKSEARTATGILTTRDEELQALPESERRKFFAEAQRFVDSVRASVFWGQVRRVLQGKEDDGAPDLLRKVIPSTSRRRDLLAGVEEREFRVAPALALDSNSKILGQTLERLEGEGGASSRPERQMVVIPDISEEKSVSDGTPEVVKLAGLRAALEAE